MEKLVIPTIAAATIHMEALVYRRQSEDTELTAQLIYILVVRS